MEQPWKVQWYVKQKNYKEDFKTSQYLNISAQSVVTVQLKKWTVDSLYPILLLYPLCAGSQPVRGNLYTVGRLQPWLDYFQISCHASHAVINQSRQPDTSVQPDNFRYQQAFSTGHCKNLKYIASVNIIKRSVSVCEIIKIKMLIGSCRITVYPI